jgi:M6 family metalloprotease-like protein
MGSYATTSSFIGAFSDQPNAMTRIGVVGHEMGHMLGLPDLLSSEGSGVGNYDCMGNMWGKDRSQYFPGLMSA